MRTELMRDELRLRNPLCVRWHDEGHKLLTDTAWRMRVPASALVRTLVEEGLARLASVDGVGVAESSESPAHTSGVGQSKSEV